MCEALPPTLRDPTLRCLVMGRRADAQAYGYYFLKLSELIIDVRSTAADP